MKAAHILSLISGIVLGGCSQDMPVAEKVHSERSPLSDRISLDEALANADALFGRIEGKTRGSARHVGSIAYMGAPKTTRSAEASDTMYYLVNYADEAGFAVLSADRRLGEVFAISPEGSLSVEDTVENKGLAYFFRGLDDLTSRANAPSDGTYGFDPVPTVNPFDSISLIDTFVSPKLPKTVQRWPGNKYSPLYGKYDNIAISIAQAMAYFRKPAIWTAWDSSTSDRVMNWPLITSYQFGSSSSSSDPGLKEIESLIASLEHIFVIGGEYGVGCGYFDQYAMRSFGETYGYKIGQIDSPAGSIGHEHQEPESSSASDWRRALDEDRIIVAIDSFESLDYLEYMVTWAVDGYVKYVNNSRWFLTPYNTDTMFHCVWGRGGACDGYYAFMADTERFVTTPIKTDSPVTPNLPLETVIWPARYTFKAK